MGTIDEGPVVLERGFNMARCREHEKFGTGIALAVDLLLQVKDIRLSAGGPMGWLEALGHIDLLELLLAAGGGTLASMLPDGFEPADSPIHRGVCHSTTAGVALVGWAFGQGSHDWNPRTRRLARAWACAYLSHLWLDGKTRSGLPLLASGF